MDFTLIRTAHREDGIFGKLEDTTGNFFCVTLEHAYSEGPGIWVPKIPAGVYKCVRGEHRLAHMAAPFTTFEITDVPGHTNVLLHRGNYNADSEGCILLGTFLANATEPWTISGSAPIFNKFMALQSGLNSFLLTVKESL